MADVSFHEDIRPFFEQYRTQMLWRMDLASYEDVKANAELILQRLDLKLLETNGLTRMPPPPLPPFPESLVDDFKSWIEQGFPD